MVHMLVRITMMMKMTAVIPRSSIIPKSKTTVKTIIVKIVAPTIKYLHFNVFNVMSSERVNKVLSIDRLKYINDHHNKPNSEWPGDHEILAGTCVSFSLK